MYRLPYLLSTWTCLTASWTLNQPLQHQMNSNGTSHQMLRMWKMAFCGGMRDVESFQGYHTWPVTTSLFLVSISSPCVYLMCWHLCCIATTVDVKCVFSCGRLVLPHVCSRLAVQSTCTSLCVGLWSSQGLVKDTNIKAAMTLDKITREEEELSADWDAICMDRMDDML